MEDGVDIAMIGSFIGTDAKHSMEPKSSVPRSRERGSVIDRSPFDTVTAPSLDALTCLLAAWRDRDDAESLSKRRHLYRMLYKAIVTGALPFGTCLPPSRRLASALEIARNTVIAVYRQLDDERLVASDGRRGTRVRYRRPHPREPNQTSVLPPVRVSERARRTRSLTVGHRALAPGEPDAEIFPRIEWRRALAIAGRLQGDALGYRDLRQRRFRTLLARHLATYRSLDIDPDRLVVTCGTRQSLLLFATLFAEPGDRVWMESPGYTGAVDAFLTQGLRVEPLTVDADGARVPVDGPGPGLAYVTPCFHYPSGATLSSVRRERLLARCRRGTLSVFEDDYDSEFRDHSEPRPALAAEHERVMHAGTFSKLLFPAARVAWLVVPSSVVPTARRCLRALGGGHHTILQEAVAHLLEDGAISRHLVRARGIYARRRERLLECLDAWPEFREPGATGGGLSLVVPLDVPVHRGALEAALQRASLGAVPLEHMYPARARRPAGCAALVVGLGNVDMIGLEGAVERLALAVRSVRGRSFD